MDLIKYNLILFFILLGTKGQSQIVPVDHLRLEKGYNHPDTALINYLYWLGVEFQKEESDSSKYYLEKAINYSIELKVSKTEFDARIYLARFYMDRGDLAESFRLHLKNEALAHQSDYKRGQFLSKREISRIYRRINDFETARQYLDQMKSMLEKEEVTTSGFYPVTMNFNEGQYYALTKAYDTANSYFKKVYQYGKQLNDEIWIALGSYGLGNTYRMLDQPDSSLHYFRIAESKGPEIQRYDIYRGSLVGLGELFYRKHEFDSTLYYAKRSYNLSKQYSDLSTVLSASELMEKTFAAKNQFDSAYRYAGFSKVYSDSLFGMNSMNRLQSFAINNQIQEMKRNQELEKAEQEYKSNLRIYSLFGGLVILIIIILFISRVSRQRAKSKEQIENAFEKLKSTQSQLIHSEKMASLGELTAGIAHEIQNPLNFVNNFSEVSNELLDEMKDELVKGDVDEGLIIADDIKQNLQKIHHHGQRASGIVKGMLEHSRTSDGKKELTDLNDLADEYLRLAYHGLRAKDKSFNADFQTDFDSSLPKINVIPQDIGRVLLNLINNAFYVVNIKAKEGIEGYKPEVCVFTKLSPLEGGVRGMKITVKDNGPGISEEIKDKIFQPFFTTKPTGSGTGLGLSLSYDIVKAHGGELKLETIEGKGSEFIIQLPT